MAPTAIAVIRLYTALILAIFGGLAFAQEPTEVDAQDSFVGVWSAHYQTTFVYLIIHSDRTANFILLDQGYQVSQTRWSPAKNGIIVDGLPKFRLWKGASPDSARVQMQDFPQEATNDTFARFPLHFHMKKQSHDDRWDTGFDEKTLPSGWLSKDPPADFPEKAGMPRSAPTDGG